VKQLKRTIIFGVVIVLALVACSQSPKGAAPFVYLREKEEDGYEFVEYYPTENQKNYVNKRVDGVHYRNSYYDGEKLYLSLSHTLFVYDSKTKTVKELKGKISNAIKKINGEVWLALDNGLQETGYSSSLCKINEKIEVDCLYEIKNQQVDDFYLDFSRQTFYAAGPGVGKEAGELQQQLKVVKYDMQTGEETSLKNNGRHIIAARVTNICPGQFVTSDAEIYQETGEKIGDLLGTKGQKLHNQINDLVMNETTFLDYDNMLLEVYGCENNKIIHKRTINLNYEPNTYPAAHSWETTDEGEISMPINEKDDIFKFIGFQSVNTRTGVVEVYLFDEPVYRLHAIARFD